MKYLRIVLWIGWLSWILVGTTRADETTPQELANAGMEQGAPGEPPPGWYFHSNCGAQAVIVGENAFAGMQAAKIDASTADGKGEPFSNLMQSISAEAWRGKRIHLRAAVRVADMGEGATAQVWLRVDRPKGPDGYPQIGGFDNMDDRPIQSETYQHYDIVLDVAADAEYLAGGLFISGAGVAWLDDITLQLADSDELPTGIDRSKEGEMTSSLPSALKRAFAEAESAPQQPFFTHWLWLPAVAFAFFVLAMWPAGAQVHEDVQKSLRLSLPRLFAIRLTVVYWVIYCLPEPFSKLLPGVGGHLATLFDWIHAQLAALTARVCFGFVDELVPPNGSGDTTHSYLQALNGFVLTLILALVWTALAGRARWRWNYGLVLDLLRSYLRYVLAAAMLGYGIAKVTPLYNQFPLLNQYQLEKTWGDSSPMNVVWAFMGASRPYTVFAGCSEILAGLLLLSRRTALLGSFLALGVMTNIVLLNYCYDVPVKLYSSHLWWMAFIIVLPDAARLADVFVWNRSTAASTLPNAWNGRRLKWVRRVLKTLAILMCAVLPLFALATSIVEQYTKPADTSTAPPTSRLTNRGYRWINEVPFNR